MYCIFQFKANAKREGQSMKRSRIVFFKSWIKSFMLKSADTGRSSRKTHFPLLIILF